MKSRLSKRAVLTLMSALCVLGIASYGIAYAASGSLKKGLKVFVIPNIR